MKSSMFRYSISLSQEGNPIEPRSGTSQSRILYFLVLPNEFQLVDSEFRPLDALVAASHQRQGIGTQLVALAAEEARKAGCEWLHVDFDPEHRTFYIEACGFKTADAGLIRL